ncbi:related to FMO1 Flavin-containing monooxygenase [Ramularia collo-cygni]|uniref:Related to FMO1 Flavin-containing monooxygenase n=1 Tax=Ramularia collo-cygni TaxID=112498 RepID=A0A2D3VP11_9PEZI|nr:related to FMO1 Flavin-containing monooxygenase [Ramularia collo-cygni]CZT24744.1 related to FMO1 Flavin-containing monooxygenase [Ramularia collo-cygni]
MQSPKAMKSVCIVGAGPAGLAAAKVLAPRFRVTVFEQSGKIGGIWQDANDGFLGPETPTNLSRYTVGFSDLDWNSIELGASAIPLFPKAWQVNRYLLAYAKKLPRDTIKLGHKVVRTERIASQDSSTATWSITIRHEESGEQTRKFDYLVMGTGFFSRPRPLSAAVANVSLHDTKVTSLHSSRFRKLQDLFPDDQDAAGRTILMIGGGNSSGETAANIAQQLSDSQYSPDSSMRERYKECKVIHVTPRPLYALPPFVPANAEYNTFMPLDLKLYDLSRRLPGDISGNAGRVADTVKNMIHQSMQATIGGDQSDLGSLGLVIPPGEPRSAVHVAISESYPEFVRSGLISVIPGRVTAVEATQEGDAIACVRQADGETVIENVGAVVFATGFSPHNAIDILPEDVKQELHYDPNSSRLPIVLSAWQTMVRSVPDLAFVGFYEGPYWGIIEMQARLTAHRWLKGDIPPQREFEETDKLLDLRSRMQHRSLDVPQYWFGDPLGYSEEIARYLQLERNDGPFEDREGCMSPARYLSFDTDGSAAGSIVRDLHQAWNACKEGRYVARAAFRALQGNWNIERTIRSALSSYPSGTLEGKAGFYPRFPTPDKTGQTFDFEYLYIESGTLVLSNGAMMNARKRYVYRYNEADDKLSVWFVKPDNDLEVDYLFHNMAFVSPTEAAKEHACIAKADHLCVEDMYETEYRFPFSGISLLEFETQHTVKGPSKDYVATTSYRRPDLNCADSQNQRS